MTFMSTTLPPRARLLALGATYGALWSLVAAALHVLMHEPLASAAQQLLTYAPAGALTGIAVTWLLRRRLQGARPVRTLLTGPLALLVGTVIFACILGLLALALDGFAGRRPNLHDSLILLYWCPVMAFGAIFPVALAMLNCWDLRRRLAQMPLA